MVSKKQRIAQLNWAIKHCSNSYDRMDLMQELYELRAEKEEEDDA